MISKCAYSILGECCDTETERIHAILKTAMSIMANLFDNPKKYKKTSANTLILF